MGTNLKCFHFVWSGKVPSFIDTCRKADGTRSMCCFWSSSKFLLWSGQLLLIWFHQFANLIALASLSYVHHWINEQSLCSQDGLQFYLAGIHISLQPMSPLCLLGCGVQFSWDCADPDLLTGRFVDSIYFDLKGDPMYVMSTDGVLSRTHTSTYLCICLALVISSYLHVSMSR